MRSEERAILNAAYPPSVLEGRWLWSGPRATDAFEPFALRSGTDEAFTARLERRRLGDLTVSRFASTTQQSRWPRIDGEDGVLAVSFLQMGAIRLLDGSPGTVFTPGSFFLTSPDDAWSYRSETPVGFVSLMLRAPLIDPSVGAMVRSASFDTTERSPAAQALRQCLQAITLRQPRSHQAAVSLESALRNLSFSIIDAELAGPDPDGDEYLWWRAQQFIDFQSANDRLAPADVAAALRVSLRKLQNLFAEHAASVAGEIRRRRTELAARLLRAAPDTRLAEVAARSGFSSADLLSRAFVREFGVRPSEYAASVATAAVEDTDGLPQPDGRAGRPPGPIEFWPERN